jgi:hypothetical protein
MEEQVRLSQRLIIIDNGLDFKGILHCGVLRVVDKFCFELKLRRFKIISDEIFATVKSEINKHSFDRVDLIDKIDNDILFTHLMSLYDCEQYYQFLGKQINHILTNDPDKSNNKYYRFIIDNKLKVILSLIDAKRLYSDIQSFVNNYMTLDSIYKLIMTQQLSDTSIEDHHDPEYYDYVNNVAADVKETLHEKDLQSGIIEQSYFDDVLDLCLNNAVKSYILHETLTYFGTNSAAIKHEDNKIILPSLFRNIPFFPSSYLKTLIISLSKIGEHKLDHYIGQIIVYLKSNNKDQVKIFIATFLLFLYYLVKTYKTHPGDVLLSLEIWISKIETQTKLLNYYTQDNNLTFEVISVKEENEFDKISEISEKHKYLLRVSPDEFVTTVFTEYIDLKENKQKPMSFNLSHPTVINITRYFFNDNVTMLTNYRPNQESNPEVITFAYGYFLNFVSSSDLSKDILLKNTTIPITVLKLFPILSNNINSKNFNKDIVDTFVFYKTVCGFLEDPSIFQHIDILYIVFQIIIPYYYHMYEQTTFTDYFLG